jgi:hypothetical protein
VSGKVFHCKRGVRQDDPLSPLLFVLAADLLQSIINKAKNACLLRLPINLGYTSDFPILQYADDTLLIMEVNSQQLMVLKSILNTFADSTGLKVNYAKSSMYPINISQEKLQHMSATFPCSAGALPFTYLGLPLSTTKPNVQDCLPLLLRIERRPLNTSIFRTQGGKLQMVNSVISSLPTYFMCLIKLPVDIINQIEKYRRHCLWAGGDVNARKPPLAAWKLVTRPKMKGGLGIIRLRLQNDALLMKNLHTKADPPWVQLICSKYYSNCKLPSVVMKGSCWWRSMLRLLNSFKGIAQAHLGSGDTILFWNNLWNGRVLRL